MYLEQSLEQDAMLSNADAEERFEGRRAAKHLASELRRLVVAAAQALPADRALWFRRPMNPRWTR